MPPARHCAMHTIDLLAEHGKLEFSASVGPIVLPFRQNVKFKHRVEMEIFNIHCVSIRIKTTFLKYR